MDKLTLQAEKRKTTGRKIKKLRREGILPANVYGKDVKSQAIEITYKDFLSIYKKSGETNIIEVNLGNEKKPVLVHSIQKDPVTENILHVDFLQVDLKKKVTANIPIELVGESPVEKQGLGTVVQYIDEVEVEALPSDLPEKFELNLTSLTGVDSSIFVKDIEADKDKVVITNDPDQILVRVEEVRKEEVTEVKVEEQPAEGQEQTQEQTTTVDSQETNKSD